MGVRAIEVCYPPSDPRVLAGCLLPEPALWGACTVAFLEAVDAEGLFRVAVFVVGQAVGAERSQSLPFFRVADVSALEAAEGVAAEGTRSVGVVGGALGAEGGDACCRVVDATESDLLLFVSWEEHSVA